MSMNFSYPESKEISDIGIPNAIIEDFIAL